MGTARNRFKKEWVRRTTQIAFLIAFVLLTVVAPLTSIGWLPSQLFSRLDPLVGLTAIIASRTLVAYALFGVITITLTVLFGRVWCGWVCPLGTVLDLVPARSRTRAALPAWLRFGKYATLLIVIGAAVIGRLSPMIMDPITIAMRPLQEIVMPWVGSDAVGLSVGQQLSSGALGFLAYLSLLPVVIVVSLNALARRFWCSSLCPLGGLLAVVSRLSQARRGVDADTCTSCGKCARECPVSAISPDRAFASDVGECITCLHCVDTCPPEATSFALRWPPAIVPPHSAERRESLALLGASALSIAGVVAMPVVNAAAAPLRPPGTDEDRLAERCVRCGACYSACPTGALKPSVSMTTKSGLWTPMLEERPPHCSLNCNLCAKVCPTDALHTPTPIESALLGLGGVATVDRSLCVAWARGRDCLECKGVCPIVGAITSTREEVITHGSRHTPYVPHVVEELCIGCGACSAKCPVTPKAMTIRH